MSATDPLAVPPEAVEAAMRAAWDDQLGSRAYADYTPEQLADGERHYRIALEAAAPLIREQALADVRALLDTAGEHNLHAGFTYRCARCLADELRAAIGDPPC